MKIVIFGLGSIGKRHAKILQDNFSHDLFAFRSGKNPAKENNLGVKEIYSWEEVKRLRPDVALIANPTFLHIRAALKCAFLGMHLFIEKPLSNSLAGINSLETVCRKKKLTCYTAYCLRFHPVIKELRKLISGKKIYHVRITCSSYLPHWRKGNNLKGSYAGIASQGGGVLLELSHEFDYIKYLFGEIKIVSGVYGKAGNVSFDSEDFADLLLSARNARYINLHLNFLSLLNERRIVIDYEGGCLVGDLVQNKIEKLSGFKKKTKKFASERDDYFKEQLEYFFDNLRNRSLMNNPGEAKRLLAEILKFKHG